MSEIERDTPESNEALDRFEKAAREDIRANAANPPGTEAKPNPEVERALRDWQRLHPDSALSKADKSPEEPHE